MKITPGYFRVVSWLVLLTFAGWANAQNVPSEERVTPERPGIGDMLEQVTPAVVNISVTGRANLPQNPLYNDPFFRRFFNLPEDPPSRPRVSVGSGVIIDAQEGYILTNHHVVENAEEIEVTFTDRRQEPATLVGSDEATDVALLQVEADNLTEIPMSDSETLRVGDYVVAIGNPFGIGQTVTTGIVSALGRQTGIIAQGEGYENFIQTDASINPGNSGGALVDYNGNLVGINTAIIAPSGGNVGIGFAVPINMAMTVVDQLLEYGEVRRGMLGVLIQDVTPEVVEVMELEVERGAVVSRVEAGSAAEEAGLEAGDVIVGLNGTPVEGAGDLRNRIGLMRAGAEVEITFIRDGEEMTVDAVIGEASTQLTSGSGPITSQNFLQGAEVANIPPSHSRYGEVNGVLVTGVEQGSRAWQNGLRADDIILEVNRQPVENRRELLEIVENSPRGAAVRVLRGDLVMFLVMR